MIGDRNIEILFVNKPFFLPMFLVKEVGLFVECFSYLRVISHVVGLHLKGEPDIHITI